MLSLLEFAPWIALFCLFSLCLLFFFFCLLLFFLLFLFVFTLLVILSSVCSRATIQYQPKSKIHNARNARVPTSPKQFPFCTFRVSHTLTRQQNQNPQKGLSRLDLLLSFHRNKPKVGSCSCHAMFCHDFSS